MHGLLPPILQINAKILFLGEDLLDHFIQNCNAHHHLDSLSLSETLSLKHLSVMWETEVPSLGGEDLLEKEMSTQSTLLARKIPWTEEPGGLQSTGSQRATSPSNFMTEQLHD